VGKNVGIGERRHSILPHLPILFPQLDIWKGENNGERGKIWFKGENNGQRGKIWFMGEKIDKKGKNIIFFPLAQIFCIMWRTISQ